MKGVSGRLYFLSHDDWFLSMITFNSNQPKEENLFWEFEIDFISGMMGQKLNQQWHQDGLKVFTLFILLTFYPY